MWSRVVAGTMLLGVFALSACGGNGDDGAAVVANGQVTVGASEFQFDVTEIRTEPGPLRVTLVEKGSINHTFVIEGIDDFKLAVDGESRSTRTIDLQPGAYVYYCDVPGHRAQGMEGTLTVE